MKLNNLHVAISTLVAVGGLGLGVYQTVFKAETKVAIPQVQVTLAVPAKEDGEIASAKPTNAGGKSDIVYKTEVDTTGLDVSKVSVIKADSAQLFSNMRASLAMISSAYVQSTDVADKRNSNRVVVAAVKETAEALNALEISIKSKSGKDVSKNTRRVSKSIGKLQTALEIVPQRPLRAQKGIGCV